LKFIGGISKDGAMNFFKVGGEVNTLEGGGSTVKTLKLEERKWGCMTPPGPMVAPPCRTGRRDLMAACERFWRVNYSVIYKRQGYITKPGV